MTHVPIHGRGSVIRGWAIVDDEDVALVSGYRWHFDKGYASSWNRGCSVLMHRLILGLEKGDGIEADHVNRRRHDNRRANLRRVTRFQNRQNLGVRPKSLARGVGLHPEGGWRARVVVKGHEYMRRASTRSAAEKAVRELRAQHMPYSVEVAE